MNRTEVDRQIEACERCKSEACDCEEVVRAMNAKLDVLHAVRDSVPAQPSP